LKGIDPHNRLGYLQRVLTINGDVRWVCDKHADITLATDKEQEIKRIIADQFASTNGSILFDSVAYELRLEPHIS
jgi:hypothetical protein